MTLLNQSRFSKSHLFTLFTLILSITISQAQNPELDCEADFVTLNFTGTYQDLDVPTTLLDGFLAANGTLAARTDRLDGDVARIADSRERLTLRLQATESRLLAQFSAMDSLVAQLNATSSFLDQQLGVLANIVQGDDG